MHACMALFCVTGNVANATEHALHHRMRFLNAGCMRPALRATGSQMPCHSAAFVICPMCVVRFLWPLPLVLCAEFIADSDFNVRTLISSVFTSKDSDQQGASPPEHRLIESGVANLTC